MPSTLLSFGLTREEEQRFCQASLAADLARARICFLILAFTFAVFSFTDFHYYGFSWPFPGMAVLRALPLGSVIILFVLSKRIVSYATFSRMALVWCLAFIAVLEGIALTRPQDVAFSMASVAVMFVLLLVVPNSFLNQLAIAAAILAGQAAVLSRGSPTPLFAAATAFGMPIAALIALSNAWLLQAYRRRTFIAISNEVAAREAAEARAKEAEEGRRTLDALLAYIPEGITIASAPDVATIKTSKYGDRLLRDGWDGTSGMSMQDWLAKVEHYLADGRTPAHEEDLPLWKAVKLGESVEGQEMVLRRPDGKLMPILCNAGPIKDESGKINGGVVAWRSIADRKRTEGERENLLERLEEKAAQLQWVNEELDARGVEIADQARELESANEELLANNQELQDATRSLREAQDYLESLITYANAPIIVWDPKFAVTRFNQAFERFSGRKAKDIIGRDLRVLFPPDNGEEALENIRRALEGEHWDSVEIPILHRDGGVRIALWNSANVYDEEGRLLATIAQGQDITARKESEKELEEAKAQAELYLDLMGHDISNMHQIMLVQLELAQELLDKEEMLGPASRHLVDVSVETLEKAAKLIDNVRSLQKLKIGEYHFQQVELGKMIKDVLKLYSKIPGREISLIFCPDGEYFVQANPLLKDVFVNLIDNAVKHSDRKLEILVNVGSVDDEARSFYRVSIEDNGNGIPDAKKTEVFERLKRGGTKAKGTGLGLFLVKSIVEGFGGHAEVEDRIKGDWTKGARFSVYLPATDGGNNDGDGAGEHSRNRRRPADGEDLRASVRSDEP